VGDDKRKKPIFKRWWFWLLVIIVIIAIANSGGNDTNKVNDNQTKNETGGKKDTTKKEETKKTFGIGEKVTIGDMQYTVNSKSVTDQVGPSVLPEKASGKFVVIDVTVRNNGNEAVTVDASYFKLKRGDKTYEADTAASMSANQSESGAIENSFFMQQLNPDSEMAGRVVFDVAPEVADATDLQLQVQTGAFGTETELINLQ
jgi:hypothetical protein